MDFVFLITLILFAGLAQQKFFHCPVCPTTFLWVLSLTSGFVTVVWKWLQICKKNTLIPTFSLDIIIEGYDNELRMINSAFTWLRLWLLVFFVWSAMQEKSSSSMSRSNACCYGIASAMVIRHFFNTANDSIMVCYMIEQPTIDIYSFQYIMTLFASAFSHASTQHLCMNVGLLLAHVRSQSCKQTLWNFPITFFVLFFGGCVAGDCYKVHAFNWYMLQAEVERQSAAASIQSMMSCTSIQCIAAQGTSIWNSVGSLSAASKGLVTSIFDFSIRRVGANGGVLSVFVSAVVRDTVEFCSASRTRVSTGELCTAATMIVFIIYIIANEVMAGFKISSLFASISGMAKGDYCLGNAVSARAGGALFGFFAALVVCWLSTPQSQVERGQQSPSFRGGIASADGMAGRTFAPHGLDWRLAPTAAASSAAPIPWSGPDISSSCWPTTSSPAEALALLAFITAIPPPVAPQIYSGSESAAAPPLPASAWPAPGRLIASAGPADPALPAPPDSAPPESAAETAAASEMAASAGAVSSEPRAAARLGRKRPLDRGCAPKPRGGGPAGDDWNKKARPGPALGQPSSP